MWRAGDAPEAERSFRGILGARETPRGILWVAAAELGRLLLSLNRTDEAEALAKWLEGRSTGAESDWWVRFLRGHIALSTAGPQEALRIFAPLDSPGASVDTRSEVVLWVARATAFEALGERDAAINAYREARRLHREAGIRVLPLHAELDLCRGIVRISELLADADNLDESEAEALRFLDEFPYAKEAGAHATICLARIAEQKGDTPEALSVLERIPIDYPSIASVREEAAAAWARIMAAAPAPAESEVSFGDPRAL